MCGESLSLCCVRLIRIEAASQLTHPDVEALNPAIDQATTPLPAKGRGRLIIQSVAANQGRAGGRRRDVGGYWDAYNALGAC
jgi:hypothetical protein